MTERKKKLIGNVLSIVGVVAILVGTLFKIQHWPFGAEIYLTGFILFFFYH